MTPDFRDGADARLVRELRAVRRVALDMLLQYVDRSFLVVSFVEYMRWY